MSITRRVINIVKYNILKVDYMEEYIEKLRSAGIEIGDKCRIYSEIKMNRDCCLLSIGNNVTIARGVNFIMHDNAIIKASGGVYTDLLGRISIGDNCFIGVGSIILPGVSIAKDNIIGAGSVVTKSIPTQGNIVAGNPARIIGTVDEYFKKNEKNAFNLNGIDLNGIRDLYRTQGHKFITKSDMQ